MRSPLHSSGDAFGNDRTPLKTIRHLGSARAGTEHFIQSRITGVANLVLIVVLAVVAICLSGRDYASAVALVGSPWVAVPLALAIISVAIHMKLGVQNIIEDYVHGAAGIVLMLLTTFFSVAIAASALFAIVKIMLAVIAGGVETGA